MIRLPFPRFPPSLGLFPSPCSLPLLAQKAAWSSSRNPPLAMPKLICKNQVAFIKGRSIYHNILLAWSGTSIPPQKGRKFASKLISKRPLILSIGNPVTTHCWRWASHISGFAGFTTALKLLNTPSSSMALLLGSLTTQMILDKPLSPYLFTIVTEGFSCMLKDAVARGELKVPCVGDTSVSHIIIAKDLIIFLQDDIPSI